MTFFERNTFRTAVPRLCSIALLAVVLFKARTSFALGITVITHGYGGDANGWVTAMANDIPHYPGSTAPSSNFTIYKITLTTDGTSYFYQWSPTNATPPTLTDSGEVIVKLDWSQMAGGTSAPYDISTYNVAWIAAYVLLQTNAISALGGHALAEFPIHLIGHSRGGSLISEMSRILGTNGVWIDHLTTLDPHPLNNDGFTDPLPVTDAPVHTYQNVLFHDNFWEDLNFYPWGEAVADAYVRPLNSSLAAYSVSGYSYHSDVHLWYHGTVNLATPTGYNLNGDAATIDSGVRANWYAPYELSGARAGFNYSLLGGGNRLSIAHPFGPGYSAIVDGYNQYWDLGAGLSNNRIALPSNPRPWPNLIKLSLTGTNTVTAGSPIATRTYYQYAGTSSNVNLQFWFDADSNPLYRVGIFGTQYTLTNTGPNAVFGANLSVGTSNAPAGTYRLYGRISDGIHTRYLYAPEKIQVLPAAPVLNIAQAQPNQILVSVTTSVGATIVLEHGADLAAWTPLATNTLSGNSWIYTNNLNGAVTPAQFYRARLLP